MAEPSPPRPAPDVMRRARGERGMVSGVAVALAIATFVVMVGVSLVASSAWRSNLQPDAEARFAHDGAGVRETVAMGVDAVERSAAATGERIAPGVDDVDARAFDEGAAADLDLAGAPGVLSMAVVRTPPAGPLDAAALEAWVDVQRDQLDDPTWSVRGPEQADQRYVVTLEHDPGGVQLSGLDLAGEPELADALATAAERPGTVVAAPVDDRLLGDGQSPVSGDVFALVSVVPDGAGTDDDVWVMATVSADALLAPSAAIDDEVELTIDLEAPVVAPGAATDVTVTADLDPADDAARYRLLVGSPLDLVVVDRDGELSSTGDEPLLILGAGTALGVLLAALVYVLARSRDMALQLVDESTATLRRSEEHFKALVQNGSDLILVADPEWVVRYTSPSVLQLLGFTSDDILGRPFLDGVHPEDVEAIVGDGEGGRGTIEARIRHRDGTWRHFEGVVTDLRDDPAVEGFVLTAHDVSERKAVERRLAHDATHDPLTGLPNRVLLLDRLEHALAIAARDSSHVAVIFLDLDRFKWINDSLGHAVGDELIVAVARRLRHAARKADTVARFGGDEFVIVCESVPDPEEATRIAERLVEGIGGPITLGDQETVVGVSIGIAVSAGPTTTSDDLMRDADAAMYRAKEKGRGRIEMFSEVMRSTALHRLNTESMLRRAVELGELRLHYQPIYSLVDERVVGYEALVRWQHPDAGLIPPDEFMPIAEDTGLVVPIGNWVMRESLRQAMEWQRVDPSERFIAVNVSARQLADPEMVDVVRRIIQPLDIASSGLTLCLELTESCLTEDPVASQAILGQLRELGVRVAVDDFGTGFSSLSYLKHFPVDVLKIDRMFVSGLHHDNGDAAIVAAVISMGEALGLTVVAEGVETLEQADELYAMGCDHAQGFLFARPAPPGDIVLPPEPLGTGRSRR